MVSGGQVALACELESASLRIPAPAPINLQLRRNPAPWRGPTGRPHRQLQCGAELACLQRQAIPASAAALQTTTQPAITKSRQTKAQSRPRHHSNIKPTTDTRT